MEYQDFKTAEKDGKLLVGVEPAVARRFFTEINGKDAIELTDNNLFWERISIKLFMILELLFAILTILLSIFSLKWYSLIFIPFFLIFWIKYKLGASLANQNISGVIFITLIVFASSLFFFKENLMVVFLCLSTPLTFLFCKLIYKASTIFLRSAVINYPKIYELLLDKGIFIKHMNIKEKDKDEKLNDQQDKFKVAGKWFGDGCSLILLLSFLVIFYCIGHVLFEVISGRPISLKGITSIRSLIIFGICSVCGVIFLKSKKK